MANNPWDGTALGLELGDPARVLTLGWKHSLVASSLQEGEERLEAVVRGNLSIKLIQMLEEISNITSEIHQLEQELHQHRLDKSTADFTHIDLLEERLSCMDKLLAHMTQISQGKDTLLGQLQTKVSKNSLNIEASCQKHAHNVLTSMGPSIQHFPAHSSLLDWGKKLDARSMPDACQHVEENLINCQAMYHTVDELHRRQQKQQTPSVEL